MVFFFTDSKEIADIFNNYLSLIGLKTGKLLNKPTQLLIIFSYLLTTCLFRSVARSSIDHFSVLMSVSNSLFFISLLFPSPPLNTTCSQHVHNMFTTFLWHDHDMFTPCSRHVHDMLTTCLWHVHNKFTKCSRHVHDMFMTCSQHVHNIFMTCSQHVQDMFKTCSQHVNNMFMTCSQQVH